MDKKEIRERLSNYNVGCPVCSSFAEESSLSEPSDGVQFVCSVCSCQFEILDVSLPAHFESKAEEGKMRHPDFDELTGAEKKNELAHQKAWKEWHEKQAKK